MRTTQRTQRTFSAEVTAMTASFVVALCLALAAADFASAAPIDPYDHLECYRIQDPLDLHALVDLKSRLFGIDRGCQVTMPAVHAAPAVLQSGTDRAPRRPDLPRRGARCRARL